MRYLAALIIGIAVLFGVNAFAGLFSMPRPWNSLSMGATVGITMVIVLLIWEVVKPSNKDAAPAKSAMSEEERANARAERRSRLAAEAGVSLDDDDSNNGNDGAARESETDSDEAARVEVSPVSDESSMEDEPNAADASQPESIETEEGSPAEDDGHTAGGSGFQEPETLAADEFDEEATGSSLENPPTGEPGVSVDALEGSESGDAEDPERVEESEDAVGPSASEGTPKY